MYDNVIVVGAGVVGVLLLAKDPEHITTDMPLLTPYLSPTLTFFPFWKSREGEWDMCEVGVDGGLYVIVYCVLSGYRMGRWRRRCADGVCPKGVGGVKA